MGKLGVIMETGQTDLFAQARSKSQMSAYSVSKYTTYGMDFMLYLGHQICHRDPYITYSILYMCYSEAYASSLPISY